MTNELENVTVQLKVNLSLIVTLGLYDGALTKKTIADNVFDTILAYTENGDNVEDLMDSFEILGVMHNEQDMVVAQ